MIIIEDDRNKKVKFNGRISSVSRKKRNYKTETTIYGNPITNHTGVGAEFEVSIKNVEEDIKDKIVDIFLNADTITIRDNETGKLYSKMIFEGDSIDEKEIFDYDKNVYL